MFQFSTKSFSAHFPFSQFQSEMEIKVGIGLNDSKNLLFDIHVTFRDKVIFQPLSLQQLSQVDLRVKTVSKTNLVTMT